LTTVKVLGLAGEFAENKDVARSIRQGKIMPAIERGEEISLDFEGVNLATQSFMHALISEVIREKGPDSLDLIVFENCNENVKSLVNIVVTYSQQSIDPDVDIE
jgi:hypothetical protein